MGSEHGTWWLISEQVNPRWICPHLALIYSHLSNTIWIFPYSVLWEVHTIKIEGLVVWGLCYERTVSPVNFFALLPFVQWRVLCFLRGQWKLICIFAPANIMPEYCRRSYLWWEITKFRRAWISTEVLLPMLWPH